MFCALFVTHKTNANKLGFTISDIKVKLAFINTSVSQNFVLHLHFFLGPTIRKKIKMKRIELEGRVSF